MMFLLHLRASRRGAALLVFSSDKPSNSSEAHSSNQREPDAGGIVVGLHNRALVG